MKILYITPRLPYPPYKGDQLIAYNQLKYLLNEKHEIYLVCFISNEVNEDEINKIIPLCKEVYLIRLTKKRMILNSMKTIINLKPLQVNAYTFKKARKELFRIYEELNPDIVHVQTCRVAGYFMNTNTVKVLDMIDVLSLNMHRRARREKFVLKPIFYFESMLLKCFEKKALERYNKILLVSENDRTYLENKNIDKIIINPNGTFITKDYISKYSNIVKEKYIVFHGNMQYYPNVEAVTSFVKNIWPYFYEKYNDLKFYIIGKDPVKSIKELHGKQNIIVTGFVDDICLSLRKAILGVYPLNSGTGMQNKILEALACGLPIIVSPLAIQGIKGISENEVMLANSKIEYIEAIDKLINDDEKKEYYSQAGQNFVFENYSWESNGKKLTYAWKNAIN